MQKQILMKPFRAALLLTAAYGFYPVHIQYTSCIELNNLDVKIIPCSSNFH